MIFQFLFLQKGYHNRLFMENRVVILKTPKSISEILKIKINKRIIRTTYQTCN